MEKNQRVLYGEIVSRAWEDEEFKKHFLTSPEEVLKEAGITVEEGVEYKVIEAPKLTQYVVLPHEGQQEALEQLTKLLLAKADQTQTIFPEGTELRIVQNTDAIRHLVLPASPKTLTAAELKMIAGGGSTTVTTEEIVATSVVEAATVATTATVALEVTLGVVVVGVIVLI